MNILVSAELFEIEKVHIGASCDGPLPRRTKQEKAASLVWWDDDLNEWSIDVFYGGQNNRGVVLRKNGKPTSITEIHWKMWNSKIVRNLVVCKVPVGVFKNETLIDIRVPIAYACVMEIFESVSIGDESDSLPFVL